MVYKRLKISHSMSFMINTQSVERMTVNHDVEGSSPSVPAIAYISLGLEMI